MDFINSLSPVNRSKAYRYLEILTIMGNKIREPYSKHLNDGIFELRPSADGLAARILYFFDIDAAIITNGFIKQSKKTPSKMIELAKKSRCEHNLRKGQ